MEFEAALCKTLAKYAPGITLKPEQKRSLEYIFNGCDTVVNLPTGFGKSLIYQLLPGLFNSLTSPAAERGSSVLVVSPLNVIQADQAQRLFEAGISTCVLDMNCQAYVPALNGQKRPLKLEEVRKGKYNIIHCHPESLLEAEEGKLLLSNRFFTQSIRALVIDECHKADEWKEFRAAFASLFSLRSFLTPGTPVLALSGTLTCQQLKTIPTALGLHGHKLVQVSPERANVTLNVIRKRGAVCDAYEAIVQEEICSLKALQGKYPVTLLYLPLQHMATAMAYCMSMFGQPNLSSDRYAAYYSRQHDAVRTHIAADLKSANPHIRLVFCTAAVGMGFDSPSIVRVIHANPPRNLNDYFQEIGRGGRAGQQAEATLYYSPRDIAKNLPGGVFAKTCPSPSNTIILWGCLKTVYQTSMKVICSIEKSHDSEPLRTTCQLLLEVIFTKIFKYVNEGIKTDIVDYCKATDCLRQHILQHFGFHKGEDSPSGCKCCSNCRKHCNCDICTEVVGENEVDYS